MILLQSQPPSTWASPGTATVVVVLSLLVGWLGHRLAKAHGLRRFRAWLRSLELTAGAVAVTVGAFAIARAITAYWFFLGTGIVGVFVLTNLSWLRNAMAGIALAAEGRFHTGDNVEIKAIQGEIESFHLRSIAVRSTDGRLHIIPNSTFLDSDVASLDSGGDSACDVEISIPDTLTTDRARRLARHAATMTPLASPRHEPDIFVTTTSSERSDSVQAQSQADTTRRRVHIRGYACQPKYREHYQGDVVFRLLKSFETETTDTRDA